MEIKITAKALADLITTAVMGEDNLHEESTMEEIIEVLENTEYYAIINTDNMEGIEILS